MMTKTLYEEALEQLTAWRGKDDPYAPVTLYDGVATTQSATCVVTTRAGLMSLQSPKPHGLHGWGGSSVDFECSRDEQVALLAAGATDNRSALSKKIIALRDQHIQAKGSPPTVVGISPADERAWIANGIPQQLEGKFKAEGRDAVVRFHDMRIEWDAPTTVVS